MSELLTVEERQHVPGWLLKLIDGDNLYELNYAARHCSSRWIIELLERRIAQLESREQSV